METLQFKTNINCGGCIAKATPVLNNEKGIQEWSVDTNVPTKILTITSDLDANKIIAVLDKAGFKAEKL
ncbi:MAG TPA: heavy-metal-associated domain-containing protein [Ferruginibacter sp.]|nr:heavy-metal-associated domain-containing protein [Ferruginibacter sp.]